ncbi:transcriptional regulator, SarA/Rot family [Nguyenibacter vanlangensis]|nr:MarR family transcriptional regulator [Nguyenibacter vanlangensis]
MLRLGTTYPQYLVMNVLWEKNGQSVGAVADRLALESSTITPLVMHLEAAEFVRRQRNSDDERQVVVTLRSKGVALRQDATCFAATLLKRLALRYPILSASLNRSAASGTPSSLPLRKQGNRPRFGLFASGSENLCCGDSLVSERWMVAILSIFGQAAIGEDRVIRGLLEQSDQAIGPVTRRDIFHRIAERAASAASSGNDIPVDMNIGAPGAEARSSGAGRGVHS